MIERWNQSVFCYWVINPKTPCPVAAYRMITTDPDSVTWGVYDYDYDAELDVYLALNPRVALIAGLPIVIPGPRRTSRHQKAGVKT